MNDTPHAPAQEETRTWRGVSLPLWLMALALAVNLLVRLVAACGPLEYLDSISIPDDAFLSLTIARNLAHGQGFYFGTAPTSGFQPLYVLMMAPVFYFCRDPYYVPLRCALILLSVIETIGLGIMLRWMARHVRHGLALALLAAAWIVNGVLLSMTLDGLETMLGMTLVVAILAQVDWLEARNKASGWFVLGLLFGMGTLARIDTLLLVPILAWAWWLVARRQERGWKIRTALLAVLGFVVIYGPWLICLWKATGDFYPISGKAVRQLTLLEAQPITNWVTFYHHKFRIAWLIIFRSNQWLMNMVLVLMVAVMGLGVRQAARAHAAKPLVAGAKGLLKTLKPARWIFLFIAVLVMAYAGYILTWWYFQRYLAPAVLALLVGFTLLVDALLDFAPEGRRKMFAFGMLAIVVSCGLSSKYFTVNFAWNRTREPEGYYLRMGRWVQRNIPPGSTVASTQTGGLGYFGDHLRVINLDGVVNKEAYAAIGERRLWDYMLREHVEYFIDWPGQVWLLRKGSGGREPVLQLQAKLEERVADAGRPVWYVWRVGHEGALR